MKTSRIYIFPALLCVMAVSCSKEQTAGIPAPSDSPVVFLAGTATEDAARTKSQNAITTESLSSFGLYAGWSSGNFSSSTDKANNYASNLQYVKDGSSYTGSSKSCYWPKNGNLSFFAYAPYGASVTPPSTYDKGMLAVEFSVNDNVTNQTDFVIATPVMNQTSSAGSVNLAFHHTLCQVDFYVNYSGTVPSGYNMIVDKITLSNLVFKDVLTFSDSSPYFSWGGTTSSKKAFSISRNAAEIKYEAVPTQGSNSSGIKVTSELGVMFMIPQSIAADDVTITVDYCWTTSEGATVASFSDSAQLPAATWQTGRVENYHITIDQRANSQLLISHDSTYAIQAWQDGHSKDITIE